MILNNIKYQRGFVQLIVIFALASVSSLLTGMLLKSINTGAGLQAFERHVIGNIVASSGVRRVLAAIEDRQDNLETDILNSENPLLIEIESAKVILSIEGEQGKINPLTIAPNILNNYFSNLTLPVDVRSRLLSEINATRSDGDAIEAMDAIYRYLLPVVDYQKLLADFGSFNKTAGINPIYASKRVLLSLPDLSASDVERIIDVRSSDPIAIQNLSEHFTTGDAIFSIVATIRWKKNERYTRRLVIEILPNGEVLVLKNVH